jgi:hypothetical protein
MTLVVLAVLPVAEGYLDRWAGVTQSRRIGDQ